MGKRNSIVRVISSSRSKLSTTFITLPAEVVLRVIFLGNPSNKAQKSNTRARGTKDQSFISNCRGPPRIGRNCKSDSSGRCHRSCHRRRATDKF